MNNPIPQVPNSGKGAEGRSGTWQDLAAGVVPGALPHPTPTRQHSEVTGICYPVRARSDWQVRVGTVILHTDVPAFTLLI